MTSDESQAVTVGYVSRGQGAGPLLITQRAGLFEREDLDVEIRFVDGSRQQTAELVSGELLFGNMAAGPSFISAVAAGADLVFITGGINQQFLVGRPGTSGFEDIAGGSIAVHQADQLPDFLSRLVITRMKSNGLAAPERIEGMSRKECASGLIGGTIDAVVLSPPAAIEARRQGCSFILDFNDWGLNYTLGGIATLRSTTVEYPDLVKKFLKAYVSGIHRYKTDRDLAIDSQQDYSGIIDRSIAEETYEITESGMPRKPYPVTTGLAILLDNLWNIDSATPPLTPERLVDATFIRELDEGGYIDGLYV